ncbi:DUF559 domain-containing protein [Pseudonocardia sp. RS010]|uniref:DUF559 domain-containing protein n=1 Tax=Pseudonocardia sp. RS010 TaxID=3385979 RepID=UPI00399FBBB7
MSLDRIVERQAGVVGLAQALDCGLSEDQIARRVASGRWVRLHPRVFLVAGHRRGDEARIRAASLWAGPTGALSGATAAHLHGMLARCPPMVQVTVPARLRRRPTPGITLRRRDLAPADVEVVEGIRATAAPLTALETALALPDGSAFLDRALQRHVRFAAVLRAYHRNMGARGWKRTGRLIAAAADRAESEAERRFLALLRTAGITGWVLGLQTPAGEVDVAFPLARVAVEVDGWAWHVDVERFRADRRKQNALVIDGWTLLRFTWHDLVNRPEAVVAQLRTALRRAA